MGGIIARSRARFSSGEQKCSNAPIEMIESEYPIRIERYGFVPDSCGPGRNRGGLSLVREWISKEAGGVPDVQEIRRQFWRDTPEQRRALEALEAEAEAAKEAGEFDDNSGRMHAFAKLQKMRAHLGRALHEVGFGGFIIDDHVPQLVDDTSWGHRGRAHATAARPPHASGGSASTVVRVPS